MALSSRPHAVAAPGSQPVIITVDPAVVGPVVPERLSLATLAALCDILGCQPGDIIEPVASSGASRAAAAPPRALPRPVRARVLKQ